MPKIDPNSQEWSPAARWILKELDIAPRIHPQCPSAATALTEDGKLFMVVSPQWDEWSNETRDWVLQHEAGHVAGGHFIRGMTLKTNVEKRGEEYDQMKFNKCCDAAIHYLIPKRPDELVEKMQSEVVTYDLLKIPPVPPEIAYDMVQEEGEEEGKECGREGFLSEAFPGQDKLSGKARARALIASIRGSQEIHGGLKGVIGSSSKMTLPQLAPAYPPWMVKLLTLMKRTVSYDQPVRKWTRETRMDVEPICMPGKGPQLGIAATFIVDMSGSMERDPLLRFFGAVEATPELANSEVGLFSDGVQGPVPVRMLRSLLDEAESGGTAFHQGATLRKPGVPVVWFTDGYPGDGWPEPHDTTEVWVMSTDVIPPHGICIRADE